MIETNTYGYSNTQWADLLTSYNGQTITYDNMGNPTSYLGKTLEWEGKKLISAQIPVTAGRIKTAEYAYNEDGLRLSKVYDGTTTEYYYNGSVLIGMKIGTGSTAKILRFSYDASGNVVAVDYSTNNGSSFTTYYYLRNAQNDIVKIVDNTGAAVVEYIYDSWGKLLSVTGSLTTTLGTDQPFRYRGYVYDTETQLYYLQSRYYDPNTCRFISADVLLSTGQGVIGHNAFAYCNNNPVALTDEGGCVPNYNTMMTDSGTSSPEYGLYLLHQHEREKQRLSKEIKSSLNKKYGKASVQSGCFGSVLFGIPFVGLSLCTGIDTNGDAAFIVNFCIGGGTPGKGAGAVLTYTRNAMISDLDGYSGFAGASANVYKCLAAGGDFSIGSTITGEPTYGFSTSFGVSDGPIPAEIHGGLSFSKTFWSFNVIDALLNLFG